MGAVLLLVDDSLTSRSSLVHAIEMSGYPVSQIYQAANGKEALDVLNEHWVDLVFSDLNMPVMDGQELLINIRSNQLYEDVPVIIITSEGNKSHWDELTENGVNHIYRKPFRAEKLNQIFNDQLGSWEETQS